MTVKARVEYDAAYLRDRIIIGDSDGGRVVTWRDGEGRWVYPATISEREEVKHLLIHDDEILRALYEALAEHFGGTGRDARALRKDYDAERERVDKLIDALVEQPLTVVQDGEAVMVARGTGNVTILNQGSAQ